MSADKKQIGAFGENLAAKYLKSQGYKIVDQNITTRYGEIDIIAQKKNQIYFVEIKTRRGNSFGSALEAVTPQKVNKIHRSAESLLSKNRRWQEMIPFISVIAIDEDQNGTVKIEFLPNAYG